ncbi:MAG TPA: hypothetical protein VGG51_01850 [Candidatus Cybelea sp.]
MRFQFLVRAFVGSCTGFALLCGCGGSPSSVPFVPASAVPPAQRAVGKIGPLLYVVGQKGVYVLDFPSGQLRSTIQENGYAACSDKKGNVFIAGDHGLDEFKHGGTTPIAHLVLPYTTNGCSFDPTTQTLAATSGGYVAVFHEEQNPAVMYSSGFSASECGYDNTGDLYVDGYAYPNVFSFAVQPHAERNFYQVTLPAGMNATAGQVQWDGTYITIESGVGKTNALKIFRLTVPKTFKAQLAGTVTLSLASIYPALSWLHTVTSQIIVPYQIGDSSKTSSLGYWKYPAGGPPVKKMSKNFGSKSGALLGVTLSVSGS